MNLKAWFSTQICVGIGFPLAPRYTLSVLGDFTPFQCLCSGGNLQYCAFYTIGTLLFNGISSKFSKSSLFCQKSAFLVKILSRNIAWTPYFFERFQKKYKLSESTEIEGDLDQFSLILVGFCMEFSRKNVESLSEVYFLFFGRKKFVLIVYWGFVEICQKYQFFFKKLIFLAKSEYFSKCG